MAFTAQRIDHVEVFVRDLEAAVRWYDETLGLKEARRWNPEPIMVGAGGTMLALFKASAAPRPDPGEAPHWHRTAWHTDAAGFEEAQEHLRGLGIPFEGPIDHRIGRSIYFVDPDGNPLEITTYDRPQEGD
jgi:catechol-2,3-dioxygenase